MQICTAERVSPLIFLFLRLTCNLQRCISALHGSSRVARHTPVHSAVLFLLAVHRPEEEQRPGGKQDVVRSKFDRFTILEPPDLRFRFAFRLAVEGDGIIFRHQHVAGMFRYPGRPELS